MHKDVFIYRCDWKITEGGELFLNEEIFHHALYGIVDFVITTFWGNN